MTSHRLCRLSCAIALAAVSVSVAAMPSHAEGVNIIYPPKLASAFDRPADKQIVSGPKSVVNVAVTVNAVHRHDYRREAIRRAFGHRYLGFIKMYSGPRYPF